MNFNFKTANAKTLMYNKIYTGIFEKQKILDLTKKSVLQLSETLKMVDKEPLLFRATKKATLLYSKINLYLLYLEHLNFLIKKAGWQITNAYSHYTFEKGIHRTV